jgi:polysaccharide pyruvyl transferase WcaK-like protein
LRRAGDYAAALSGTKPIFSYIGYLGHGNVGDEALFAAFRDVLFAEALVLPEDDYSFLKVFGNARRRQIVMLGGGTLINVDPYLPPLQRCRSAGQRYVVWGTGVADLDFWTGHPEQTGRGNADSWLTVLRGAEYIGVRGPRSRAWLTENGIENVEVIGDPALSVAKAKPSERRENNVLGINLGSHDPVSGGQGPVYNAVVALIEHALRNGLRVKYLSLHEIDEQIGRNLESSLGSEGLDVLPFSASVQETLNQLAGIDFLVGQRLHATVLACAQGVPNLSLSYQPKCLDFLESIGQAVLAVPTDDISAPALIQRFDWLVHSAGALRVQIELECSRFKSLQLASAQRLMKVW